MADRIHYLWERYLTGNSTEAEYFEMAKLLQEQPAEFESLLEASIDSVDLDHILPEERARQILTTIFAAKQPAPVKRLFPWKRWMAAASVILVAGIAVLLFNKKSPDNPDLLSQDQRLKNDINAPRDTRATLRLANGQLIVLDTVKDGSMIAQANKINNGELVYTTINNIPAQSPEMLTLNVPRGSRPMKVKLADGTDVWLNAGSSITYPSFFTGNHRKVAMTGEAYFEVAHDKVRPFYVTKGEMEVKVLGTHFNINAYDDEDAMRVTLLEGSVSVSRQSTVNSRQLAVLKRGEQAVLNTQPLALSNTLNPNLEEVMAWKNGNFQFEGAGIEQVMRQVARWYDIEVVYQDKVANRKLRGTIPRNVQASQLFRMLEATGGAHFRMEGNKVFVTE